MKIQFLGTGAGIPAKQRNVSSLVLKLLDELNEVWMFDCGEATQHQILKTTLKPRKITNIFITHLHGDHIYGLPGFLSSRSFQGGEGPLTIYGPPGIRSFVNNSLKYSKTSLQYPLKIQELDPAGGVIKLPQNWQVDYLPLNHGILCFGYRIIEPDQAGQLLIEKLKPYNIPNGPMLGELKRGQSVTLDDGTVLNGKDYIAPPRSGKIVTILGDTRKTVNSEILAQTANTLVHEATHGATEAQMAHNYFHSTSKQAALVAKNAGVNQLFMNHISARYLGKMAEQLEKEAQAIFPDSRVVYDLDEFNIL